MSAGRSSDKQLKSRVNTVPHRKSNSVASLVLALLFACLPAAAPAMTAVPVYEVAPIGSAPPAAVKIAQSNGMTLSQAVESVRSRGNVERVISATTRSSGGREVHHIRVMTKDGKVRTYKVQGRRRS